MFIYLACFLLTYICCIVVQKNKNNKIIKWIFIILAVTIPSFIGGMRDETIGTDVLVYGKTSFLTATNFDSFGKYMEQIGGTSVGYVFVNFIVSRFTSNLNIFFFISQLVINGLVFATIYRYKDKYSIAMAMLYYLCVYYCRTFNFLKQSFALSIIFFGIRYIEDRKLFKYLICVFLAALFHPSAIIAIFFYIANYILHTKYKVIFTYFLVVGACLGVMLFPTILQLINDIYILPERYSVYVEELVRNQTTFSKVDTFFRAIFIGMYVLCMKKTNKDNKINALLGVSIVLDLILFQLRNTIQYTDRIAFYFGYMNILLVPQIQKYILNDEKGKFIFNCGVIAVLLFFWYYKFAVTLSCEVYPYTSVILGI